MFDFNLIEGLVTHLVGLTFVLWSFSHDGCEELCLNCPWLKVLPN